MSELKRCPFCGGEARLQKINKHGAYYVICKTCGCRTPKYQHRFTSKEERQEDAIEAWNTRKPMERIVERLEKIKENAWDEEYQTMCDAIEIVKEEGGL